MPKNSTPPTAEQRAQREKIARYIAAFVFPFIMVTMMVTGYLGAMHSPSPNNMPVAVTAASPQQAQQFADALEQSAPDAVDVRVVATADEARTLVFDREVTGAVALPDSPAEAATIYTATGAGASQLSAVNGLLTPVLAADGFDIHAEDLAPTPATDPGGLAPMFLTTALILAGYMPLSLLLSVAPELLRLRRFLPILAGWSVLAALIAWVIAGPVIGAAVGANAWAIIGIAALAVFSVGLVQLFLTRILGPLAVLIGMLFLMVLGIPSSNLGMSVYTMPSIFPFLHNFLPSPAVGEALRSVLYFGGSGVGGHLLVLVIGAAAALAAVAGIDALKRRKKPIEEPVATMVSLTASTTPPRTWVRYTSLAFLPLAMMVMMLSLMLSAMHEPTPRELPVVVVAETPQAADAMKVGLDERMAGMFDVSTSTSIAEAQSQVHDRDVVAAYVLPSTATPSAQLITNGGAGQSQQQVVTAVFGQLAESQGLPLEITDVAPLTADDSAGTVSLYIAIGWMMAGFLVIVVIANAAPDLMSTRKLLPLIVGWAVFMAAVIWLIAGPIVGAISGNFLALVGMGALAITATALFSIIFVRLFGLLAVLPLVSIIMFLGVPASGGGLSIHLVPEVFAWLHDYLPLPAAVESVRSILYFGGDTVGSHAIVLVAWGAVSLLVVRLMDRFYPQPERPIPGAAEPSTPTVDDASNEAADDNGDGEGEGDSAKSDERAAAMVTAGDDGRSV
ncbi:MAG: ABC transporter permease [Gordonia sp. (in: high G+C Gram-positive bacteria)]|uniref:ABC transporter permease n=1 Tax=Gordonia sp. (in: high G+C Gram-positive bacteria) TaxID=84139 RepID=UPI003BB5B41B